MDKFTCEARTETCGKESTPNAGLNAAPILAWYCSNKNAFSTSGSGDSLNRPITRFNDFNPFWHKRVFESVAAMKKQRTKSDSDVTRHFLSGFKNSNFDSLRVINGKELVAAIILKKVRDSIETIKSISN